MLNIGQLALTALLVLSLSKVFHVMQMEEYSTEEILAFESWIGKWGTNFASPSEKNYRLWIFASNYRGIKAHKESLASSGLTYWTGLGKFAWLSVEEFRAKYLRPRSSKLVGSKKEPKVHSIKLGKMGHQEAEVDWRKKNAVTSVKD